MKFLIHLKKHLVSIIARPRRRRRYTRLHQGHTHTSRLWLYRWCEWVKQKAMRLRMCSALEKIPKGFLAVYVGAEERQSRVEVPVVYFNHPLFGELLKEAEDEFGYEHSGGIKLPCGISEFEKVQSEIESRCFDGGRKLMKWRRSRKAKLL